MSHLPARLVLLCVPFGLLGVGPAGGSREPAPAPAAAPESNRLRLIVETDAGGDPDDEQSLVRFLLYANEWDVEGIIANRPVARDKENANPERTGLGIVRRLVKAYGECHPNLVKHDRRYPTAEALLSRTVAGYDDTDDGVKLVIAAVDADDPRPVWFLNWGTDHGAATSCLKRALDRVLKERGPKGYAAFKNKLRLSSDDKFGDHTTKHDPPFQLWVDTFRPPIDGKRWYHRFSALTATAGGFDLKRDVQTGHGPLGALYPTNTTHPQKEGDTMTFLYLVPTGMNDPEQPAWGSWAGRYGRNPAFKDRAYYWASQTDTWDGTTHRDNTLARWAADLQNDFRARLDWCVRPVGKANHPPAVVVNGKGGTDVLHLKADPGDTLTLDAKGTSDPDGDKLTHEWFVYPEAGTYSGAVRITDANAAKASLTVPRDAAGKTIHVVLAVRDLGTPPLARYRRVVVNCTDYFPPPESRGGWRKLDKPDDVRRLAGMDPDKLAELKEWLLKSDKRDFAAVVVRNGYVVLEVERGNSAVTDSRRVASVSKAVCATVLAIASEQSRQGKTPKKMTFDDPAFDFIPQAKPLSDPRKAKITVKQLLNHTSGICPEATGAKNDGTWEYVLGHSGDPNTEKLAFDPGTASGYSTHAFHHASLVCETVTGKPYDQFAVEALFKPIGCERWWFQYYEGGEKYGKHPSHGMGMPARDLARIAYCMLHGGRWADVQVIPRWFVEETAAPTHEVKGLEMRFKRNAQSFSHGWELPALRGEAGKDIPRDARFKPGSGGQLIAFVPSLDLVVVRQTGASGEWQYEEYLRRACRAVIEEPKEPATRLGVKGTAFTLNGEPTFLLGISYYGALGAPEETIKRDLADMKKHGFNWIRVWATWAAFENDVSAVDADGKPREEYLKKLRWLVAECDRQGVVVDVTLSRGNGVTGPARLQTLEAHRRAVESIVGALKGRRNWYLDLGNERSIKDKRFVGFDELKSLRDLARKLDPDLLVTASHAGGELTKDDVRDYVQTVGVDFLSPHRPRHADSPKQTEGKTKEFLAWVKELRREVPVHYQEPFRRGFGKWQPRAEDFAADLKGARAGGAAGWCFHNGDERAAKDGKPRRSFDLREKRLFEQLDEEETKTLALLKGTN